MIEEGQGAIKGNRIYWLDNLRTFMIFLVVVIHAGGVYESSGVWASFWIVDDPSTNNLAGILFLILNIFVIATLFFISGFFAPLSAANKGVWAFLKSKFKRLMIPWAVAVLTLIPLYKIIFLYSRNLPQENWTTYFHWNSIWSQNWLWFLPVLFLFDVLYVCLSKANVTLPKINLKQAILAVFITCVVYSFCMDFFNLHGWTKIVLVDFQNERILIYFVIFMLGSLCYKLKTFESDWRNKKLEIILHCTGWIPMNLYIFLLIYSLLNPGKYIISEVVDVLLIRLNFVLSLAYLLYAMIITFKNYLNKEWAISKELSRNSYGVYIIHVIAVGAIALTMLNAAIPSLLKYLILTVSTYAACNLIVSFYRRALDRIGIKS